MPLSKISILQIGDIHFPEWQPGSTDIDVKISTFSPTIENTLRTSPLASILNQLRRVARFDSIDAVFLMGDFTTRGNTSAIINAVTAIDGIINDSISGPTIPIYGVPGNHDVSKEDAVNLGDLGKFRYIQDAFKVHKWRAPPVERFIKYRVCSKNGVSMPAYFLNSSIGSWSKALFPEPLRKAILEGKSPIKIVDENPFGDQRPTEQTPKDIVEQVYEQLDTPYFRAIDLEEISTELATDGSVAFVIAHHNLLPQYIPRISYFGEVLNGGYARQIFVRSGVCTIYLHGHIHDDPIELIENTNENSGRLISISAPDIAKGFNKISVYFTEDNRPFLLKITPYRIDKSGVVATGAMRAPILVPILKDRKSLLNRDVNRLWKFINNEIELERRGYFSWDEIAQHFTGRGGDNLDELEAAILALQCSGLITIHGLSESLETWRIEVKELAQ